MGFIKEIRSPKDVPVHYWRIAGITLNRQGTLTMHVEGYRSADSRAAGADPIDTYECVVNNADTFVKAPFYEILERCFPMFAGAEKELSVSGETQGEQVLTVQTPAGKLLDRSVIPAGSAEPDAGEPPPAG